MSSVTPHGRTGTADISKRCFVCPMRIYKGVTCYLVRIDNPLIRGQACLSHSQAEVSDGFRKYVQRELRRMKKRQEATLYLEPNPDGSLHLSAESNGDPRTEATLRVLTRAFSGSDKVRRR